jgi:restriction endonuclease Mrr
LCECEDVTDLLTENLKEYKKPEPLVIDKIIKQVLKKVGNMYYVHAFQVGAGSCHFKSMY